MMGTLQSEWRSSIASFRMFHKYCFYFVNFIGVIGIFIGMILESSHVPIPSEMLMLSGGLLIANGSTFFLALLVRFIRTFIFLPAGIAKMDFCKFVLSTFLGCLPWNIALTYLGYKLRSNSTLVETCLLQISYGIAISVGVMLAVWLIRSLRAKSEYRNVGY